MLTLSAFARRALTSLMPTTTLFLVLLLFGLPRAAHGQDLAPPLTFADSEPVIVTWPAAIRATVHNATTDQVRAVVQITDLTDRETGVALIADEILPTIPLSITLLPAGQSNLTLPVDTNVTPLPGYYTGHIVLSLPHRDTTILKAITVIVPETAAISLPVPAVEAWTLNAVRILPFLNPVCLRGFTTGCTIPIHMTERIWPEGLAHTPQPLLGYVANERGGGIAISLVGTSRGQDAMAAAPQPVAAAHDPSPDSSAMADAALTQPLQTPGYGHLALAFDRASGLLPRWGYTGVYQGDIHFTAGPSGSGDLAQDEAAPRHVRLTVQVKDIILWPILAIALGVWTAREIQRHLTVHRITLDFLHRLDAASKEFGRLRKSIYGYHVGADFLAKRQELEHRIRDWERSHYGAPTPAQHERFSRTIEAPLAAFEAQVAIWATFRDRLDRLRRKMEYVAKPAIQQAEPPSDLTVEIKSSGLPHTPEPRFYTAARGLLQGSSLELSEVAEVALRIDQTADIAEVWGEYDQLVALVRDGLRQLYNPSVDLSPAEEALLDQARQHLNSAARDLWEARNLTDLRERETRAELIEARDIVQRLLDPFVYYAGAEAVQRPVPTFQAPSGAAATANNPDYSAADKGSALPESFPSPSAAFAQPMVRSYARLDAYHLSGFDRNRPRAAHRTSLAAHGADRSAGHAALVGERIVMSTACIIALIAGLNRYAATQFGSFADYLHLFTWAFAVKALLEILNLILSSPWRRSGDETSG